MEKTVGWQSG